MRFQTNSNDLELFALLLRFNQRQTLTRKWTISRSNQNVHWLLRIPVALLRQQQKDGDLKIEDSVSHLLLPDYEKQYLAKVFHDILQSFFYRFL